MISAISSFVTPFFFAFIKWNLNELSMSPCDMSDVTVTMQRSRVQSLSVRDHTCPNSTSSFSSANFGANSPSWSRPAVTFVEDGTAALLVSDAQGNLSYTSRLTGSHHSVAV